MSKRNDEGARQGGKKRRWRFKSALKGLSNVLSCGLRVSSKRLDNLVTEELARVASRPPQLTLSLPQIHLSLSTSSLSKDENPILAAYPSTQQIRRSSVTPEDSHERPKSPGSIHVLPPELLIEIFSLTCFLDIPPTATARRSRTTPLILGDVCSRWKAIVYSTPHLWSWVLLRISKKKYKNQLTLLSEWLSRTSHHPLTIDISFADEGDWIKDPPHQLFQILLQYSERWRSIDLTLAEACYPTLSDYKGRFPNLERIALQPLLNDCYKAQVDRKRLVVFEVAPKLAHLRFNGYYLNDCIVPWGHLQELVLQHIYLDECFYALNLAPDLLRCTLSTMLINNCNRPMNKTPIKLPKLEILKMQGASGEDQSILVSQLHVPSLSELVLSSLNATAAFPRITEMVSRSGCLLRTFELNALDLKEEQLIHLLRELPAIECFRLSPLKFGPPLSNKFFEAFSHPHPTRLPSTPFLPHLQCLEYEGSSSFDGNALTRMVECRYHLEAETCDSPAFPTESVRQIQSIKLCTNSTVFLNNECQAQLAAMKAEGLSLDLTSCSGKAWLLP